MKSFSRLLTPAAVNKALDKINAKPNPAPKYTVHWRSPVTRSWQSSAEKTVAAAQKTARQLIKEGARDVSISAFEDGRAVDVPIKENPARKTRAVRVVAANPVKRPKSLYVVWTAAADGIKHERLATFEKLSEARKYAQAYADSSGKKMIVETKAL